MEHQHYGRYRLVSALGEGGMASVFLAEDPVLRRPVALKKLRRELGAQPDWVRRFHSEATSVARLGNPHVVQVFDLGRDHEEDFLVMELVEGISLGALLERHVGPIPPDAAAAIACQAASGIAAAHEAAVVHRDIKPDNILIRRDGTAKVADFGIARLTEEVSRTMTGTVMGSPLYMAPEQVEGRTPTGALDVFALGGVIYRMVSGRSPFEADHAHAVMWRIVSEPAQPLSQIVPGIDPTLADLVEKMLRKDPLERPSASESAKVLRQFLSAGGVSDPIEFVRARVLSDDIRRATPVSVSPKLVGGTLPDAAPRSAPVSAAPKRDPGRIVLWGALATGALALALVGTMFARGPGHKAFPEPSAATPNPTEIAPVSTPTTIGSSGPSGIDPSIAPSPNPETVAQPTPSPVADAGGAALRIEGRDEAPGEANALKPRLVFRNTGSRTIHRFRMGWDLAADAGRSPIVDAYYAPHCVASLVPNASGVRLVVECKDLDLRPGQVHPGADGLSLGIHYPDWSTWSGKRSAGLTKDFASIGSARIEILP